MGPQQNGASTWMNLENMLSDGSQSLNPHSICMKCSEQAISQTQKINWWLLEAGGRKGRVESDWQWLWRFFGGDEHVFKLTVVPLTQLCGYPENHQIIHFKWVNCIPIKLVFFFFFFERHKSVVSRRPPQPFQPTLCPLFVSKLLPVSLSGHHKALQASLL